jgi:cytochrome c biogenesis protein
MPVDEQAIDSVRRHADRPADHIDNRGVSGEAPTMPRLGLLEWARWAWRQLTSMRNALILLLLLAIGAIPGSLLPQRTADPNGVLQYFKANPGTAKILDFFQAFDVYTSVWLSISCCSFHSSVA